MSLQIYEDENQVAMQTRNAAKKMEAQKRTAFGQLTNIRQQPARVVKEKASTQFKIYEDVENLKPQVSEEASKPKLRKAQELQQDDFESPMALDESITEAISSSISVTDSEAEREDILYCLPEYQDEIHTYLRESELRTRPKPNYMKKQTDISPQMRTILVDWLVEVGEEYKLHDETLHLAVNYIDRFLSQMSVLRGKLQLVGTACMFLASKYEEIYPPDAAEFVYITDDTYNKKQLLKMEHLVVKVLGFDISVPTANVFIDLYCRQLGASEELRFMTRYIAELSLLDCDSYLAYRPSMIAASALFLAAHIVSAPDMKIIEKVTRYVQADVKACVQKLFHTLKGAADQPQQAIVEKYKSDARKAVSTIPVPNLC